MLLASGVDEYIGNYDMEGTSYLASDETPVSCDVSTYLSYSAILMESGKIFLLSGISFHSQATLSISASVTGQSIRDTFYGDTLSYLSNWYIVVANSWTEETSGGILYGSILQLTVFKAYS